MQYLKIWTSFKEFIAPLQYDEIGRLFEMMLDYAANGEEPDDVDGNERFLWPVAKQMINLAAEKNESLRVNGSKGGRPKTKDNQTETEETYENQTEPNETKENQTEPNETYKEKKRKEKEYKETEKEKEKEREKPLARFSPPTVDEVAAYCRERGNSINAESFIDFYSSKGWKVGNQPMKDWRACVRTWEQRERAAPAQKPVKQVVAHQYEQRDYQGGNESMDDVLDRLYGRANK